MAADTSHLTDAQRAARARLLGGTVLVNDKPFDPGAQERRGAEGAAKRERKLMAADDKLAAVRDLQARGFAIFPITAGAKAPPTIKDWPRLATADPALTGLWQDQPDLNIGIHCDGLLVVDVDTAKGGDDSLALLDMTEGVPATLTARTPSGGRHLFYRLPAGVQVPNTVSKLAPGIDTRGRGGYVVAAGSRTEKGAYTWVDAAAPIAPAPEWMVQKLGTAAELPKERTTAPVADAPDVLVYRVRDWLMTAEPAIQGQGGDARTFAVAARLRDMGLSETQATEAMIAWWNERCSPPWDGNELARKVANAYRYAQNEPGSAVATLADFDTVPVISRSPAAKADDFRAEPPPTPPASGPKRLDVFASAGNVGNGYVIKGLLQKGAYTIAYGPPGSGKTFVALDWSWHVAAGAEWHERRVKQGAVLYLAYEGAGGLRARAAALRQHYGSVEVPLYFDDTPYNLREREGRVALGKTIAQLPEAPTLIVIDTLAHALCGGDENSAQDVSAFNAGVQALIAATGACVVVVHHPGKNVANGARGSSALLGAVDTEIQIMGGNITPTKQRDIELGAAIGFKLRSIPVGMDADGDIVTSCVVEPHAAKVPDGAGKLKEGSTPALAYATLKEIRPTNDPVSDAEWREACAEFLPPRRTAWAQTRLKLKLARLIVQNEEGLWTRRLE